LQFTQYYVSATPPNAERGAAKAELTKQTTTAKISEQIKTCQALKCNFHGDLRVIFHDLFVEACQHIIRRIIH
jgi:hypothetical protein